MNTDSPAHAASRSPGASEPLAVPGLIRRVRRICDLSQADLAAQLGVCQSTVARWETGAIEPSLSMFQRLIALAGWEMEVRDPMAGGTAQPMRPDSARDRQGRRYPAHLDLVTSGLSGPPVRTRDPDTNRCAPGRRWRDWFRRNMDRDRWVRTDHLTEHEVVAIMRLQLEMAQKRRARLFERQRAQASQEAIARGEPDPYAPPPPCFCLDECFEHRGCLPTCPCACEPAIEIDADSSSESTGAPQTERDELLARLAREPWPDFSY